MDITRANIFVQDLVFTGGVVQVIDSLLIPPTDVVETADTFNLTSFEGVLYATKKFDALSYTRNITIFAPNNDAFQALGPVISNMTSDQLSSVVDYHTVPGIHFSTSFLNGSKIATEQGGNISIYQFGNNFYINSAELLTTDLLIANGVLHVIDNVLNPQGPGAQPNPQLPTQAPVFALASSAGSLPFTSAIPCTSDCPVSTTSGGSSIASNTGARATGASIGASSTFKSSSSKGHAAAMARETGLGAAGFMAVLGGAAMLV
jgi:transforming growth factor-beta-induced protein